MNINKTNIINTIISEINSVYTNESTINKVVKKSLYKLSKKELNNLYILIRTSKGTTKFNN